MLTLHAGDNVDLEAPRGGHLGKVFTVLEALIKKEVLNQPPTVEFVNLFAVLKVTVPYAFSSSTAGI